MQPTQPNDVYRPPQLQESIPSAQPERSGSIDLAQAARQREIMAAQVNLEQYFAKAALQETKPVEAALPETANSNMAEILTYVKQIGVIVEDMRRQETE